MDNVNIQISQDLIKPIIENKIKTAVIEAMGNDKVLIETVVETVLKLEEVKKQLQSKTGLSSFVNAFLTGMMKASESDYKFQANFTFQSPKD